MNKTYLRGDIFYADLGKGVGSEQEGYRPVVIIQNNVGNRHSPTVIVAAISSRTATKSKLPTHYYIGTECGLEQPSIVLLEQLRTIDKRRLNNFVGRLSAGQITEMNHALAISIDLIDSIPKNSYFAFATPVPINSAVWVFLIYARLNPRRRNTALVPTATAEMASIMRSFQKADRRRL